MKNKEHETCYFCEEPTHGILSQGTEGVGVCAFHYFELPTTGIVKQTPDGRMEIIRESNPSLEKTLISLEKQFKKGGK